MCSIVCLLQAFDHIAEDYDFDTLRQFIHLFPLSPLAQLLRAYFKYMSVPLQEDEDEGAAPADEEDVMDQLDIMTVGELLLPILRASP